MPRFKSAEELSDLIKRSIDRDEPLTFRDVFEPETRTHKAEELEPLDPKWNFLSELEKPLTTEETEVLAKFLEREMGWSQMTAQKYAGLEQEADEKRYIRELGLRVKSQRGAQNNDEEKREKAYS